MGTEMIRVTFPALNKNSSLEENDEYIREEPRPCRCKVVKSIAVPTAVYDALGSNLLSDNDMWEEIGGAESEDPRLEGVSDDILWSNKELMAIFRETCYTLVVEVKAARRRPFYVNTEGYKYARYVGRAESETRT